MSGRRVERLAAFSIDPKISRRGKLALRLARQDAIQSAKHPRRIMGKDGYGLHGHFDHRRNECSRDAMPGDVCHKDAQVVVV